MHKRQHTPEHSCGGESPQRNGSKTQLFAYYPGVAVKSHRGLRLGVCPLRRGMCWNHAERRHNVWKGVDLPWTVSRQKFTKILLALFVRYSTILHSPTWRSVRRKSRNCYWRSCVSPGWRKTGWRTRAQPCAPCWPKRGQRGYASRDPLVRAVSSSFAVQIFDQDRVVGILGMT